MIHRITQIHADRIRRFTQIHADSIGGLLGHWLSRSLTRAARRYLAGAEQPWVFESLPDDWTPGPLARTSLYLHVPFCRNCCPYCPYTKLPYQEHLLAPYTRAAVAEVDWWADAIGPAEITSIYIGGGTPTLALDSVNRILDRVRQRFRLTGNICIETNPADVDADIVSRLRDGGVNLVSLGVQSFEAPNLALLGRRYQPAAAERALALLAASGFASINVDLMFALPGQTVATITSDLARAADLGANQITTYPLFTFPYTSVGEYLRLRSVRMPALRARRAQYRAISRGCEDLGFERVSVWGFTRGSVPRYSSVTRDGYIGVGPGAGSHLPDGFTLNTFDFGSWTAAACAGRGAAALRLPFTARMHGAWWLYWRLYDTRIRLDDLDTMLGPDARKARWWLGAVERAGLANRNGHYVELTEAGAFWLHLIQNHFALGYVNTLWSAARRAPWPDAVAI